MCAAGLVRRCLISSEAFLLETMFRISLLRKIFTDLFSIGLNSVKIKIIMIKMSLERLFLEPGIERIIDALNIRFCEIEAVKQREKKEISRSSYRR